MKKCPYCAEEIQNEAVKCRHCGEMVQAPQHSSTLEANPAPAHPKLKLPVLGTLLGVIGAVFFIVFAVHLFRGGKSLAGVSGIGAGVVFMFLAPVGWVIGDAFRKFAHPDFYFAAGAIDLAKKKLFWMFGPQLAVVATIFIILFFLVSKVAETQKSNLFVAGNSKSYQRDPSHGTMQERKNIRTNTPDVIKKTAYPHKPTETQRSQKLPGEVLGAVPEASLKTTDTPATVRFECNAPEFQVFENNSLLTISNQQLTIPPLKEYTIEIRAEGYKPQTLTFKAAEPGQNLGIKRIELLGIPPGGDPNAVSWKAINEQWIKNTYKNGNITMSDLHSGEMWVYESTQSGKRDWDSAAEYCNKLNYAGYADWRLPEKEKLHELYKQKRLFSGVQDNSYWSSTVAAYDSECAWGVCMIDDCTGNVSKRGLFYAWPVRSCK